jgi:hypothetical protein
MLDSTQTVPPYLGPQLPQYPPLRQTLRVTGPGVRVLAGSPLLYPAVNEQYDGNGTLRDREPCYLFEPNNLPVPAGSYYRTRLEGAFQGPQGLLPLYAVSMACCPRVPAPSFPPASSSSSSGSPSRLSVPSFPSVGPSASSSSSPPPQLGAGSLVSGSLSFGLVATPCCPSRLFPTTLHATISGTDMCPGNLSPPGCVCADGVIVLTYGPFPSWFPGNPMEVGWSGDGDMGCGIHLYLLFGCGPPEDQVADFFLQAKWTGACTNDTFSGGGQFIHPIAPCTNQAPGCCSFCGPIQVEFLLQIDNGRTSGGLILPCDPCNANHTAPCWQQFIATCENVFILITP